MASAVFLPIILSLATGWLYLLTKYAPGMKNDEFLQLHFPSNLADLKNLASFLQDYSRSHFSYVLVLFVSAYMYKQTFAIPGSVFLNLLSGALFGMPYGFLLACWLSACGASCCFLLSKYFGKEYVLKWFPDKVNLIQAKVEENRDRLFYFLLFIRLFPLTPNWFINVASPIINIPLALFFFSAFFGLMPYNFISVQTGVILRNLHSMDEVFTTEMLVKLMMIAMAALAPIFAKRYRYTFINDGSSH